MKSNHIHHTRCSTGAIKRQNTYQLLGIAKKKKQPKYTNNYSVNHNNTSEFIQYKDEKIDDFLIGKNFKDAKLLTSIVVLEKMDNSLLSPVSQDSEHILRSDINLTQNNGRQRNMCIQSYDRQTDVHCETKCVNVENEAKYSTDELSKENQFSYDSDSSSVKLSCCSSVEQTSSTQQEIDSVCCNVLIEQEVKEEHSSFDRSDNPLKFIQNLLFDKKPRRSTHNKKISGWKRSKRDFPCSRCKMRSFATQCELDVHMSCHCDKDDSYRCPSCDYCHSNWSRMLAHLLIHPTLCEALRESEIVRNVFGSFACSDCGKVFNKKQNMNCHILKVHNHGDRICESCGEIFKSIDEKTFYEHVDNCANLEYQCEECKFITRSTYDFRKHQLMHSDDAGVCDICQAVFPSKQRLKLHRITHSEDRPIRICEHCGRKFKTKDAVEKHILRFHSNIERLWKCSICGYKAKLDADLKKHLRLVHDKKFKCSMCPFMTNQEAQLLEHLVCHGPNHNLPCTWQGCYYRAETVTELEKHCADVHNAMSKHQCLLCSKQFKKRTNLIRHLLTHTGGRPYSCNECCMTFVSHSTYYRHRQRTGHDMNRRGGASLPQSVIIQVGSNLQDKQTTLSLINMEGDKNNFIENLPGPDAEPSSSDYTCCGEEETEEESITQFDNNADNFIC